MLYSPEVLALATSLSYWPLDESTPLRGQARSQSCGSTIDMGLRCEADGTIAAIGLRAHACAIGQASAAIFAASANGKSRSDVVAAEQAIQRWLADAAPMPDWPGLSAIAPAKAYPARHGAILLAWRAAASALPSA